MKVYYEASPTDNELHDVMNGMLLEKHKYRIMWELRHLEQAIINEDGVIILALHGESFKLHLKNFTKELSDKINDALENLK